jgi:hypothetical protein
MKPIWANATIIPIFQTALQILSRFFEKKFNLSFKKDVFNIK